MFVDELNLTSLYDFFTKILIFLDRPTVRFQLVVILFSILLAWVLEKVVEARIRKPQLRLPNSLESHASRLFVVLNYLRFPSLSLIVLWINRHILIFQGSLTGLLVEAETLFWVWFFFRIFLGLLYAFFDQEVIRLYHYRFYSPLFVIYVVIKILSYLTNLEAFKNITLISIFANTLTIGSLFNAIVGLYIWIGFLSGIQDLIYLLITKRTKVQPAMAEAVLASSRYILIIIGIIVVLSELGLNTTTVAAITGGLSVGVGFSLQEIMSNFISGILLFIEGALKPGDVVEVDGEMTVVKRLSIRATTVQTFNHVEKIVPNQKFLTSSVVTYTGSDRICRNLIPVGVSYKSEPDAVIEILLKVAKENPNVLKKPKPVVFFIGFGDSSINFELSIWLDNPVYHKQITSEINQAIWRAFAANNIEIPFPQRDLHIRDIAPRDKF
ncbi:small-conductance mechanosensitive channel [Xenococcus sp. PCC 7305]|uniref:mechanosensitive ion channel family protein n=1 Tax=Xenococcus sp. PCC 7305 TaxID=102125 RepID=UPI0002AC9E03|nr:mechanosensitive ion channel domain-containing protein [Xenococcus sp. PCC 7305]ELS04483.1 small-conductance mechanosensitive channel [Xenococcus sp. PCC 7305]